MPVYQKHNRQHHVCAIYIKGGKTMATNFKITVSKSDENLHLKLIGDFDKTSSHKVLETLKKNCDGVSKIFINTSHLNHIHPFGLIEQEWSLWEQTLCAA